MLRARWGLSLMAARFERDVQCSSAGLFTGLLQGGELGVWTAVLSVIALTDYDSVFDHDRTYKRVRVDLSFSFMSQFKCYPHQSLLTHPAALDDVYDLVKP